MKKSYFGFLALFPFAAHSAVTSESLCFELSETSPVKFEFRTFTTPPANGLAAS